jgi:hypothetical protein
MNDISKVIRSKLSFLIVLIITGILYTGCISSEYKAVTVTKTGIRFSFEYPSSFQDYGYSLNSDDSVYDNRVDIMRYVSKGKMPKVDSEIIIQTMPIDQKTNAASFLEGYLEDIPLFSKNFIVLERKQKKVSSINGELLVCSGNFNQEVVGSHFISYDLKSWDVYLDYKGKIVNISLLSIADIANESERHFEHLIDSFKFLD